MLIPVWKKYIKRRSRTHLLEPRVIRSKSESLNIDDVIKAMEVNASSSYSESDVEPS
jgi:hypothetical protein